MPGAVFAPPALAPNRAPGTLARLQDARWPTPSAHQLWPCRDRARAPQAIRAPRAAPCRFSPSQSAARGQQARISGRKRERRTDRGIPSAPQSFCVLVNAPANPYTNHTYSALQRSLTPADSQDPTRETTSPAAPLRAQAQWAEQPRHARRSARRRSGSGPPRGARHFSRRRRGGCGGGSSEALCSVFRCNGLVLIHASRRTR